jgi:hypothetical protein
MTSVPVLSEQITDTEPRASTEWSFLTMALRLAMRSTPRASVTVVTIGKPSGMAATANDTNHITDQFSSFGITNPGCTSNSKHVEPGSVLEDTDETDNTNYPKGEYGKLLRQLVHVVLERSPSLFNILHHTKDDTQLGLDSSSDDDTGTTAYEWLTVNWLPIKA